MSITEGFLDGIVKDWRSEEVDSYSLKIEQIDKLIDYAIQLEARNKELVAMLRKHEWYTDHEFGETTCLECERHKPGSHLFHSSKVPPRNPNEVFGHSQDCQLAKLIGGE